MQLEHMTVSTINLGILRLVGVVDHAVLPHFRTSSGFPVCVDLGADIGAEPAEEVALLMRGPKDGAVEQSGVVKTVGQSADIDPSPFSACMGGELDLLIPLYDHGCIG